jgi:hypothetical protein
VPRRRRRRRRPHGAKDADPQMVNAVMTTMFKGLTIEVVNVTGSGWEPHSHSSNTGSDTISLKFVMWDSANSHFLRFIVVINSTCFAILHMSTMLLLDSVLK